MKFSLKKIWLITGPIILSALSILLTSIFLQITIKYFCPSFNLLANKGLGKIIFTTLVILQITLFIALHSKQFFKNFLETNLYFFKKKDFIKIFFKYFFIFLLLHSFILFIFYIAGFVIYNPNWGSFNFRLIYQTLFGFIATFFLAWTEELIFRGTIFPYLNKNFNLITSVLITNLIFMFVHDLHNPLNLITKNWQLGLGLFLLGVILNLIFILTNKLYANMGAHAGLVFVKVILRRARFILFLPASDLPFWINQDLRYSYLTHILFLITIIILIFKIKKNIKIVKPIFLFIILLLSFSLIKILYEKSYTGEKVSLENFWSKQAQNLPWFKKWDKVLDWQMPYAKWFINGQINASYVCVDQHIKDKKDKIAIHWFSETGESKDITYQELFVKVNQIASGLKNLGVTKGDRVILYLPMIPESIYFMLALARLGATHSVVFSGFSAQALKDRIIDTQAKFIITADYTSRRGKLINLKNTVDQALSGLAFVKNCIIVKRFQENIILKNSFDVLYQDLIKNSQDYIEPEKLESNHPLFILYTSGTTGKPKGIVHSTGGYLTYVYNSFKWAFNPDNNSIYWCTADIGWITGHSYLVYAPLAHGLSIVMHEGTPDYPDQDIWWKIIEKYKVNIFYTSPTALRMLMKFGQDFVNKYNLDSLKVLGSVGEPINPEVWHWYNKFVGKQKCPIIDTWWQTETGGFMICPTVGLDLVKLKPGSATIPLPEIYADVLDESGNSVTQAKGYLVIKNPWPGLTLEIYNDTNNKFLETYWSKFKGYYYSGDYAIKDQDGYFWLLGRADEVLNVSGHRIGTAEVESAIIKSGLAVEAAVVGIQDEIKGETIIAFVVLKQNFNSPVRGEPVEPNEIKNKIIESIKIEIGSFAKPKDVFFVEKLPKTRSGKIMRRVLKALAENKPIGDISTIEDAESVKEIEKLYQTI